jgi:hypothetical protein
MAIARKPTTLARAPVNVEALINRGGNPARSNGNGHRDLPITKRGSVTNPDVTPVILRVPNETLAAIDADVTARRVKTPRHTWLLEAIAEKLERGR